MTAEPIRVHLVLGASPPGYHLGHDLDYARCRLGGVTYVALGHCHAPISNMQAEVHESVDPARASPAVFRGPSEDDAFPTLLRNAVAWGIAG